MPQFNWRDKQLGPPEMVPTICPACMEPTCKRGWSIVHARYFTCYACGSRVDLTPELDAELYKLLDLMKSDGEI